MRRHVNSLPPSPWQILTDEVKTGDVSRNGKKASEHAKKRATALIEVEFAGNDSAWQAAREFQAGIGSLIDAVTQHIPETPSVRNSLRHLNANVYVASRNYLRNPDDASSDIGMDTPQVKGLVVGAYALLGLGLQEEREYVLFNHFPHHVETIQDALMSGNAYADPGKANGVIREFAVANTDIMMSLAHKPRSAFRNLQPLSYYAGNIVEAYLALVTPNTPTV